MAKVYRILPIIAISNNWFFYFRKYVNNKNMKMCKKVIIGLLVYLLFIPGLFAYSEHIIPGGDNIGISINSEGLIVVGFYKVNDIYIAKETLKIGDSILKVNNNIIESIDDLVDLISDNIENDQVNIEVKRNDKILNLKLNLVNEDGKYKTGIYIKDSVTGIGTLTYIDPLTKIYGALGHEIVLSDTGKRVEIKNGTIFSSLVSGIDRSSNGIVGSKNASISYNDQIGTVLKNSAFGIYGKITNSIKNNEIFEVANINEIKLGEAYIRTVLNEYNVETFRIKIIGFDESKINSTKSIAFEIDDERLIEETGGIVQGMSGSPIIQNNRIIGAVTNVVVDDVTRGYGIFIRKMLEEGEK